jgi:1-acyl-sn-glycerol-3-phosphate acyltransferase
MMRTFLSLIAGFGFAFLTLPFAMIYSALTHDPRPIYAIGREMFLIGMWLSGVRVKVEGLEHIAEGANYLFVANHQSYLDPAALMNCIPRDLRFMIKRELWKLPMINLGMYIADFVFVDRGSGIKARQSMNLAVKRLKNGASFLIFAEGTRTRTGRLQNFKRGPFLMAVEAKIPILPVTISGSYHLWPPCSWHINPGVIQVHLHPPVDIRGVKVREVSALMSKIKDVVASRLPEENQPLENPVEEENHD